MNRQVVYEVFVYEVFVCEVFVYEVFVYEQAGLFMKCLFMNERRVYELVSM